jgi:class 3 adenylate cyclase/tetratricopeptide (TPR) repeat protein
MATCHRCGREAAADAAFCAGCGARLDAGPAGEERKVVTVLFADLVGFTAQAETLDPEDVRALLSPYYARLRTELERFGGTVEKFIGDAVMALFGAPVAHEDDPERAVRAALAIQDWVAQESGLHVRIAVNTGEALVALGARPSEGEGMVSGDVVNTAARLQSAAPVDGILVGEQTYRATRHAIDYVPAEPVDAKGKAVPVPVWRAEGARSRIGVDVTGSHAAELVGREYELAVVRDVLGRVLHEQTAQLLTIVGAPGLGKSRLVFEALQLAGQRPEPIVWRQGRSLPYGEGISFWALAEIVKAQAGILDGDDPDETESKLRRAVEAAAGEEAPWVLRHLQVLVGVADDGAAPPTQMERFAAWRRFVEGMAEQAPTVLVFDDLHWADDGLLDFLDHLVEWVTGLPLLVIGTARPEFLERRSTWGGGKLNATTLALPPLSDEETGKLVLSLLARPLLGADEQSALVERAGGNPLYAEQYTRMLLEQGGVAGASPPESVHGIIAGRLDALAPAQKRLLQDAAVVGKVFWSAALAGMGGQEPWELQEALHALERKDLVQRARRSSVAGSEEYSFRHVLVRDVAYGQIPRATRSEKHLAVALWLESLGHGEEHAETVAHHYATALGLARAAGIDNEELRELARDALVSAADRASALHAFAQTAELSRQALELMPDEHEERPYLLLRLGRARRFSDETGADELAEARDGLLALGDRSSAAEAGVLLADLAAQAGDGAAVERHAADAEALVADLPPSAQKTAVLSMLARVQNIGGAYAAAARLAGEALEMAEEQGLDAVRASSLNTRGVARVRLGDRAGLHDVEESLELALRIHSAFDVLRGYTNLAHVSELLGDARRAHELNLEHLRVAEQLGAGALARWARANLAAGHFEQGEWEEALRLVEEFIAEVESGLPHAQEDACRMIRAEIRLARDDVEGALADLQRAVEISLGRESTSRTLAKVARVLLDSGRGDDAAAAFEELLGVGDADPGPVEAFEVACVARHFGREEDVRDRLERLSAISVWAAPAIAYLNGDFVEAAERYDAAGIPVYAARARLAAGRALAAAGRQADADEQLEAALAFFRPVGATRYLRQAEALHAASLG